MPTANVRPVRAAKSAAKGPRSTKASAKQPITANARLGNREPTDAAFASELIDAKIKALGDWRGAMLARLRTVIKAADPDVVEEWKWSTPVWSRNGIICTGETYTHVVKMTFARGAALADPARLFNSSLEGKVRRAIDLREGDKPNEAALKALIRAAVALNQSTRGKLR